MRSVVVITVITVGKEVGGYDQIDIFITGDIGNTDLSVDCIGRPSRETGKRISILIPDINLIGGFRGTDLVTDNNIEFTVSINITNRYSGKNPVIGILWPAGPIRTVGIEDENRSRLIAATGKNYLDLSIVIEIYQNR